MKQPAIMAVICKPQPKDGEWPTQIVERLECLFRNGYSPREPSRKHATTNGNSSEFDLLNDKMITVWE